MTYRICKSFTFEAAHRLPATDSPCQRVHGHSFRLDVEIESETLTKVGPCIGMVMDFEDISVIVKPLLEVSLDHRFLNDTMDTYPTAERLAQSIYKYISPRLPAKRVVKLVRVRVWETPTCWAEYEK